MRVQNDKLISTYQSNRSYKIEILRKFLRLRGVRLMQQLLLIYSGGVMYVSTLHKDVEFAFSLS